MSLRQKAILGLATGVGIGAFTQPEDAEAISARAFWEVSKEGLKNLPRATQAETALAIRRIPKIALENITHAEGVDSKQFQEIVGQRTGRGVHSFNWETGRGKVFINKEKVKPSTPIHEALHQLYFEMLPSDKKTLEDTFKKVSDAGLDTYLERITGTRIHNERELLSEIGAHVLLKNPQISKLMPTDLMARMSTLINKYKKPLFGVLATTGGLGYLNENAEAAPKLKPGEIKKGAEGILKKYLVPSSGEEQILETGFTIQGRNVQAVRKGPGKWRFLVFEDGTYMTVDKDHLHSLTADTGAREYTNFMKNRPEKVQHFQANKSLQQRYTKAQMSEFTPDEIKGNLNRYISNVEQITPETLPGQRKVLVQYKGKTMQIPREYAEKLVENNTPKFKILKGFEGVNQEYVKHLGEKIKK